MPRNSRPPNTSLYIRNVPEEARAEEIRGMFSKYGPVTDVYIPVDYYTRRHRGFAYVHITFEDPRDAEDALYYMSHARYLGIELEVEMARSDRKTPQAMRSKERGGSPYYGRYDDEDGYYRSRRRDRSHSRSPKRRRSRSRSPYKRRSYSRSRSRSPNRYGESSRRRMSRSRSESPLDRK